jgi:hypothetical protein
MHPYSSDDIACSPLRTWPCYRVRPDGVADAPSGAAIDGAPPPAGVLRDVWRALSLSQIGPAGFGVIPLVGAQCLQTEAAHTRLFDQL